MQRIKDKELEPTEWQVDPKTGERFRMIGKMREYEMTVRIDGIEVPQSQLAEFHRRRKSFTLCRLQRTQRKRQALYGKLRRYG